MEMRYGLAFESCESKSLFVFEMDSREVDQVARYISAATEFYIQMIYDDVPFRHFLRIITLKLDIPAPKGGSHDLEDKGISEIVQYPRRELCYNASLAQIHTKSRKLRVLYDASY